MHHQWSDIHDGMDVHDINGDKIGTVDKVYSGASVGTVSSMDASSPDMGASASGNYIKVETGFLGLGKDFYVPAEYVSSVDDDRVTLNSTKDSLESMGFDHKPSSID